MKLLDAEGLAMIGAVEDAKLVKLEKGKAKIVLKKVDGEVVETEPVDVDVAAKSYFIILEYMRKWGKDINPMRSGITGEG